MAGEGFVPFARDGDDAEALWFVGGLVRLLATGAETDGRYALSEHTYPGGYATPLHRMRDEEQSFYVLDGACTFAMGERFVSVVPGALVVVPRETPLAFRVDSPVVRLLVLDTPAGHEGFYRDAGEPARAVELPPPAELDMPRVLAAAEKHRVEILGPPPDFPD